MATFEQCQREYDTQTPDEDLECPICGSTDFNECFDDSWKCADCGYHEYPDFSGEDL